jgi:hypothetical protein
VLNSFSLQVIAGKECNNKPFLASLALMLESRPCKGKQQKEQNAEKGN